VQNHGDFIPESAREECKKPKWFVALAANRDWLGSSWLETRVLVRGLGR
jgi:hypothetical protein